MRMLLEHRNRHSLESIHSHLSIPTHLSPVSFPQLEYLRYACIPQHPPIQHLLTKYDFAFYSYLIS
jgi:hypothetical protein